MPSDADEARASQAYDEALLVLVMPGSAASPVSQNTGRDYRRALEAEGLLGGAVDAVTLLESCARVSSINCRSRRRRRSAICSSPPSSRANVWTHSHVRWMDANTGSILGRGSKRYAKIKAVITWNDSGRSVGELGVPVRGSSNAAITGHSAGPS